jgi:phage tail sheath gpL-like
MANKVTGRTDTSGALTTAPSILKSILVVGTKKENSTTKVKENTIFGITGTADVKAIFGDNAVVEKIVKVLIQNGADYINGMILGSSETAMADALEASMSDKSIKVIITEDNDTTTIAALKDHLTLCENNDMFRYGVIAPTEEASATQTTLIAFAETVDSDRIFIPSTLPTLNGAVVDPQVAAAGLGALIMTETDDPALPMNGVSMAGYSGLSRTMLETEMKILANNGITPLYLEGTAPTVYRLVTSCVTDESKRTIWQEGTTRFIADYVLETNENMLRANYKRTKNVTRILNAIKGDIKINMEKFEAAEIIENWDESTLTVVKDPNDQYGALVDYEFDVVTPLYTITITQHMKL